MPDPRMAFQPRRIPHAPRRIPHAPRRAAGSLVIDAEATVVARGPHHRHAPAPDDAGRSTPLQQPAGAFAEWSAADLRRPRPMPAAIFRRRPAPDLIFPGPAPRFPVPRPERAGLALFLQPRAITNRRIALGAALFSAVVLPALLVGAPDWGPAEPGLPAIAAAPGFVISEVEARIVPRGEGDVLSVDAAIRNVSAAAAPVPLLRLALGQDNGATWAKPVASAGRILAAGATLRLHSALAVPAGTGGDVSVDLMPVDVRPASGAAALR